MRTLVLRSVVLAAAVFCIAAPAGAAFAADAAPAASAITVLHADEPAGGAQSSDSSGIDVVPGATWMFVGILVSGLGLSILYLLKRRVGGFPKNPAWVAPISIERSETFAKEGDFGDVAPGAHH
ncbi:MAG: hypothetical protein R3B97_08620 [Dehalococcoidia bacterium]|nr:hypothetical protein [Dehalococcoidia bacterium]MCA9830169.1 hypothetical protein [Dehalococcoidia bacterium]